MVDRPKIWVRVVEAHATRTWVAVILAMGASISIIILVAAGMWNTISNPEVTDLSNNYTAAISSTLGVLVGALAAYVGHSPQQQNPNSPPKDDEITLQVDHHEDNP